MYSFLFIIPFLCSLVNIPNEAHSPPRPPNLNANNDIIIALPQNIDGRALGDNNNNPQDHHHNIPQGGRSPPPPPLITTTTPPIVGSSSSGGVASGSGGGNEITMEDVTIPSGSANGIMLPMKRRRDHMDYHQDTSSSTSSSPSLDILVNDEDEWQEVIHPNNQEMHVEQQLQLLEPINYYNNNGELVYPCYVCDRDFTSQRSMFGHMRTHGERDWRGAYPPPLFTLEQFQELMKRYDEIHGQEANVDEQPPNDNVANGIDLNQPGNGDEDATGVDLNQSPPNA